MIDTLAILAPGLLGGSLGIACHEKGLARRIVVWARREAVRETCLAGQWCDAAYADAIEAAREADLVVVCTPVEHILPLIRAVAPELKQGAIITDVGSTKAVICQEAPLSLPASATFVGSHPMAGSEKSGLNHARGDLFEGSPCFITPLEETSEEAFQTVRELWEGVGMEILEAAPDVHDKLVARVSHLPHFIASALSVTVGRTELPWKEACGQGLRDTTRVAAGHPAMWRDICLQNREALLKVLKDFQVCLTSFTQALEKKDFDRLEELLEEGRQYRSELTSYDN